MSKISFFCWETTEHTIYNHFLMNGSLFFELQAQSQLNGGQTFICASRRNRRRLTWYHPPLPWPLYFWITYDEENRLYSSSPSFQASYSCLFDANCAIRSRHCQLIGLKFCSKQCKKMSCRDKLKDLIRIASFNHSVQYWFMTVVKTNAWQRTILALKYFKILTL